MKVIPRPYDNTHFDAHQLTFETRKFVVDWTCGIFHDAPDPRDWELVLHIGCGVAGTARIGNWVVKQSGYFEVLTCDEFDRRYQQVDRPGN